MSTFTTLLQICLFRGKPQDLPTSTGLLLGAALSGIAIDALGLPGAGLDGRNLVFALLQTTLFGFGVWLVLSTRGFSARWIQTSTALFAVNALFSLLMLPLTPALHQMLQSTGPVEPGWQVMVAFLISSWLLAVVALILREALEVGLLASFGVALALTFGVLIVSSMLASMLGLYPQA